MEKQYRQQPCSSQVLPRGFHFLVARATKKQHSTGYFGTSPGCLKFFGFLTSVHRLFRISPLNNTTSGLLISLPAPSANGEPALKEKKYALATTATSLERHAIRYDVERSFLS